MSGGAIRALVFDFDGLILDTETADLRCWEEVYREQACELPLDGFLSNIGTHGTFDLYAELERQSGRAVDRDVVQTARRSHFAALIASERPLPGVEAYLTEARALGLRLAVASSSSREWVEGHLERLGLLSHFHTTACSDDVERVKPDPALYRLAVERLGVEPGEAVAFEDSLHGLLAAKAAGLRCVVVPNTVTASLAFEVADRQLGSLAEVPLVALLAELKAAVARGG